MKTMKMDALQINLLTKAMRAAGMAKADAVGIWTAEQMKQILTRQYEESYAEIGALAMFPVTTELARTTQTFEYRVFDGVTSAAIIADYTDDLPTVEAMSREETGKVHRFGNAWYISMDEMEVGQALGNSLSDRKASLAREGHESLIDTLVFRGSSPHKILGLFQHPNITKIVSAGWSTDAEAASDELSDLLETIETLTRGRSKVTNIVIPPSKRRLLMKRMPETTDSYLTYFQQENQGITIEANAAFEDIDGAGTKAVMAYEKNPLNMSIEIPEPFHMLPMQPRDLHFKVPCTSKATGLIIYRPMTIALLTGV